MEISISQDIDAPIEAVFERLCDFDSHEKAAVARGAKVRHRAESPRCGKGAAWHVAYEVQGKEFDGDLEVTQIDAPTLLQIAATSSSLNAFATLELEAPTANRTRLTFSVKVQPRTLTARLMIKSISLTKPKLVEKLRARVAVMVAEFENQYHRNNDT